MATKYIYIVYSKGPQNITQMWIFGLEMYHLATLLQLKGSLGATLKIPN
jgi:hypothetical protein